MKPVPWYPPGSFSSRPYLLYFLGPLALFLRASGPFALSLLIPYYLVLYLFHGQHSRREFSSVQFRQGAEMSSTFAPGGDMKEKGKGV